jgi:hypothetical protein
MSVFNPSVWENGRVPNGFWRIRANRVRYMNWLGKRLGFKTTTDWYRLTRQAFLDHYGGGLLAGIWLTLMMRRRQNGGAHRA